MPSVRPARPLRALLLFLFVAAAGGRAAAQSVTVELFEDVDRDGVRDPGEPLLAGVPVDLFGAGGATDLTATTAGDGRASFAVPANSWFAAGPRFTGGRRASLADIGADPHPIPGFPVGRLRPGALDHLVANLRGSSAANPLLHVALGDSIAFGFNLCDSPLGGNDYVNPLTGRLDLAGAASLSKLAVPGYDTSDLLIASNSGNVYSAVAAGAALVTISIGGNDFLANDGNEAATAANLVKARQNLQEILSTLVSRLPEADIVVNTVYDNEGGADAFHDRWGPIWNQMLRDVAWGQRRRVGVAEIWPEYQHRDPWTSQILGHAGLICSAFGLDGIHPVKAGYQVHLEKVWQGLGGARSGTAGDVLLAFGALDKMETRHPTAFQDLGGGATGETSAYAEDGEGALVPGGDQELRLSGFDATPRGLLSHVVINVRYRTTAAPDDDVYRFEAAVDGAFQNAGSTSSTFNTIVPIVGGAGNNGAQVLAYKDQPAYREVSALLTKGSPIDGSPALSWADLGTLAVRFKGEMLAGADPFAVEWDVASIDLYGVGPFRLLLRGTGSQGSSLRFDVTGPQGATTFLFASTGASNLPFPPFGTLLLDPSRLQILFSGSVGPSGAHTVEATVPAGLSGLTGHFQALVVENIPQRIGQLTNAATLAFP